MNEFQQKFLIFFSIFFIVGFWPIQLLSMEPVWISITNYNITETKYVVNITVNQISIN